MPVTMPGVGIGCGGLQRHLRGFLHVL